MPVSREGGMIRRDYKRSRRASDSKGGDRKLRRKVEDDARREHRANGSLLWLVILNEVDGKLILYFFEI